MTVQELKSRTTSAEKRIAFLESQLQYTAAYQPYGRGQGMTQQHDVWHPGSFQTPSRDAALRPQTFSPPVEGPDEAFYLPVGGPDQTATFAPLGNRNISALPQAVPVRSRATNYLPSRSIDKSSLMPPDVIRKYPKLKGESKVGS